MRFSYVSVYLCLIAAGVNAQAPRPPRGDDEADRGRDGISPVRGIQDRRPPTERDPPPLAESLTRSIDGSGNNLILTEMGATHTRLVRMVDSDYADAASLPAGPERPGAREVSNNVCSQTGSIPNSLDASDYLWQWGQFVDHDIDLTDGTDPPEPANIPVPLGITGSILMGRATPSSR